MNLTNQEFDLLVNINLYQNKEYKNVEENEVDLDKSINFKNNISRLIELNYISLDNYNYKVTAEGILFLDKYKVKRAVFIAAGFGSRMAPISLTTPKPLIKVNGTRMIDTLLDAVIDAGITEIVIVRGYLKECFDELLIKYPMIKFIDNDSFAEGNNILSAKLVSDLFDCAYVLDADLVLSNKHLIRKYEYRCNYTAYKVLRTDDWRLCLLNDQITGMKKGGVDCYQMVGISFWTHEAGVSFKKDIMSVLATTDGKDCYWDDVMLTKFRENYNVYLRECNPSDVVEIDTYEELTEIDESYK